MTTPKLHLYIHTPVPIFKARVNLASATYPIASIPYDGVTLGAYTDISFDALLLLGTTEGADDLGRVRVSKLASATRIYIARSGKGIEDGTLTVQDNAYITVLDDYPVYAKIPYFDLDNGIDFKDGDVPPGNFNTQIPPKANAGPAFADYIDPDTGLITVVLPDGATNSSFAMADGATIVSYAWDVKDGTITVGTNTDPVITVTFPAGFRWVVHTVIDSNGKGHTMRVPILAVDPENDVTQKHYSVSQRLEIKGQGLTLELFDNLDRTTYPDGSLVLFWWDRASSPSSRAHMKFVGWTHSESHTAARDKVGLKRGLTIQCVDATGRLALLPGFPQALEREESDSLWSYMPGLDIRKSLYYLLFWHSTVLNVADLTLPSYLDEYDTMRLDANGGNLFDQVNLQANKIVPDHLFVCNSKGQLSVIKDWRLEDEGDRPTSSPIITENQWNDMQVEYTRHPKVHVLRSAALLTSTEFIEIDGVTTLPVAVSIAPSDAEAFGQGTSEHSENEGLALTQVALNKAEGHRYAMLNSRYGPFRFSDPRNTAFWDYEPALMNRVQVNIPASIALLRGLNFTQASGLVKDVNVQYQRGKTGLNIKVSLTWEKEESGYPAITYNPEDVEDDVDYVPPPPLAPPDNGLLEGQEMVAGIGIDGYIYTTSDFQTPSGSGGPTWTKSSLSIPAPVFTWVVDPFSPGYAPGATSGAINGWAVNETDVYRLEDIFGTLSITSVHTFSEEALSASYNWRSIQASFGAYFAEGDNPWLLCVSYYGSTLGHEGTWVTRSLDGGATWSEEIQVSPYYAYTDEVTPVWGFFRDGIGLVEVTSGPYGSAFVKAEVTNGEDETDSAWLLFGIPANTKRVEMRGYWRAERTQDTSEGGSVAMSGSVAMTAQPSGVSQTETMDYTAPPLGGSSDEHFEVVWTKGTFTTNWPGTDTQLTTVPFVADHTDFMRLRLTTTVNTSDLADGMYTISVEMTVVEIEMDDGRIIHPLTHPMPIGVYASPKTPGLAYTAAYKDGNSGPPVTWGYRNNAGVWSIGETSPHGHISVSASTTDAVVTNDERLTLHPPAETLRMKVQGTWKAVHVEAPNSFGDSQASGFIADLLETSFTTDFVYSAPPGDNGQTQGVFTAEFTRTSGTVWPYNSTQILTDPPPSVLDYVNFRCRAAVNSSGGSFNQAISEMSVRVVEIELNDGTIYNPSDIVSDGYVSSDWGETWTALDGAFIAPNQGLAGSIHLPWPDNADEQIVYHGSFDRSGNRLFRLLSDELDISPSEAGVSYGVNRGHFSVRSFDSNRQYMLLAGIGNEISNDPADDKHALFISEDAGETWDLVLGPLNNTYSPFGRPALEAAFSGDTEQVFFIWGPAAYIQYTSDMGATVDDRSGNLSALGSPAFVGIAGGPGA